jgi:hypothetical protein
MHISALKGEVLFLSICAQLRALSYLTGWTMDVGDWDKAAEDFVSLPVLVHSQLLFAITGLDRCLQIGSAAVSNRVGSCNFGAQ